MNDLSLQTTLEKTARNKQDARSTLERMSNGIISTLDLDRYFLDPNDVIQAFTEYLEASVPGIFLIPILKKTSQNGDFTYSDPSGRFRSSIDKTSGKRPDMESLFDLSVQTPIGSSGDTIGWIISGGDTSETDAAHLSGHIDRNRDYFSSQYEAVKNAYIDTMTGLGSKHLFNQLKDSTTLHLVFSDAIGFKSVNDAYGQDIGDKAIQFIAEGIRKSIPTRPDDRLIRLGGDEFVMAFDSTGSGSSKVVERAENALHEYFKAHPFIFTYVDKNGKTQSESLFLSLRTVKKLADGTTPLQELMAEASRDASESAGGAIRKGWKRILGALDTIEGTSERNTLIKQMRQDLEKLEKSP